MILARYDTQTDGERPFRPFPFSLRAAWHAYRKPRRKERTMKMVICEDCGEEFDLVMAEDEEREFELSREWHPADK